MRRQVSRCDAGRDQLRDCFDFNENFVVDNDIRPKPERYRSGPIDDGNSGLPLKRYPGFGQFDAEAFLIDGLQQSRPDIPVHLDRQTDNGGSQRPMFQHSHPPRTSMLSRVLHGKTY